MAQSNWKDILNSTLAGLPDNDSNSPSENKEIIISNKASIVRQNLIIRFEKRNGKPATIISNFQGTEQELKDLATKLKKYCSVGGSAKDDEILIQGDVRNKVADYLRKQNFTVRGDLK